MFKKTRNFFIGVLAICTSSLSANASEISYSGNMGFMSDYI